jgi:CubicO group peptidase (beta-lactamase class C family)
MIGYEIMPHGEHAGSAAMIPSTRAAISALVLSSAVACSEQHAPSPAALAASSSATQPDARIARVENGLTGRVHVVGEPIDAWSIAERMAFHKVPGVSIAVVEDGQIAWAKGYGVLEADNAAPVDAATIFQAASISKPTSVIAALRMVEQGTLALDAPINDYLTSWQVPSNTFTEQRPVTLRHIMTHTAGFTVHGFPGYSDARSLPTVVQVLNGEPPANTPAVRVDKLPGESWRYSGGGYTVMQLAMTDVSGKSFSELMSELVLVPAGMSRSTFEQPLPEAERANAATAHGGDGSVVPSRSHVYPEIAAAGLWTTPSDLARLGLAVVAASRAEPRALLSPVLTRDMLTTQAGSYGLGFNLEDRGDGQVFSHGGSNMGFISLFFTYADGRGGAALMTNSQNGGALIDEIAAAISGVYGWKYGAPEERAARTLTHQRAAEFVGDYLAPSPPGSPQRELTFTISAEGEKLWLEAPGIPRQRFYVASDTQVFLRVSPMLTFTADAQGRPQSIHLGPGLVATRKTE